MKWSDVKSDGQSNFLVPDKSHIVNGFHEFLVALYWYQFFNFMRRG